MDEKADSDSLWLEFLTALYDDKEPEDDNDEEVNDPEYSISEDLLQLDDDWDFSDDRAVKVTAYELDLLLDEEDTDIDIPNVTEALIDSTQPIADDLFDQNSVKLLVTQWSQHIQLLTQTYMQSMNTNGLQTVAQNANSMLDQINEYSDTKSNPIYSSLNIKPVIEIIKQNPIQTSDQKPQSMTSWRSLPVSQENQKIYLSNPHIFTDTWLLPICGYYDKRIDKNKCKTVFTLAEDHLIALGLEQFLPICSLRLCYKYIRQLLLPIKTVDQIRTHIKNIKRRAKEEKDSENHFKDNPIIYQSVEGKAPQTQSGILDANLDTYLAFKSFPDWYRKAIKANQLESSDQFSSANKTHINCNFMPKPKKFKSVNTTQNDKLKNYFTSHQSPVKQTNLIVKKYKYLNRLNPIKPALNACNVRLKKMCSQNQTIDICGQTSSDNSFTQHLVTNEKTKYTDNHNELRLDKTHNSDIISKTNTLNDRTLSPKDIDKPSNEEDVDLDDESDLAALMTASSTITAKNKNKSKSTNEVNNTSILPLNVNKKEGRKSLAVKQRESTLQLLSLDFNESDPYSHQKEDILIQNYLQKVRNSVKNEEYIRFLSLLSDFHQKRNEKELVPKKGFIKEMFSQIEEFFKKANVSKELMSEFVLFLSAEQAEECGRMFDFLYWKRFFNFVRKLEIYSSNDSQCLQRLLRSLNQLKQNRENCDKNKIRLAVSRVLNGHTYLMNEFSTLDLNEKPSEYLFEDEDFDEIVMDSSDDEDGTETADKMSFENINIPESDDELKYGTNECPCKSCPTGHTTQHCISCSIRFIGGRVYLTQNHKKLGLADIRFAEYDNNATISETIKHSIDDNNDEDMNESDSELEAESSRALENNRENKVWNISDDKLLLEVCQTRIMDDKHNDLNDEFFDEVAITLDKHPNEVIIRFNKLMELFASELDSHPIPKESSL